MKYIVGLIAVTSILGGGYYWYLDDEEYWTNEPVVEHSDKDVYNVIVVGAGAAGMIAARELERSDWNYLVLEASDTHGGRLKKNDQLADFPIDLGAEWIHEDPAILETIVGEDGPIEIETIVYNPREFFYWNGRELIDVSNELDGYQEYKFADTTWFDVFDQYVFPEIRNNIRYNSPVTEVDYSGPVVKITTQGGDEYDAEQVIMAVPVHVLQKQYIDFVPDLPDWKQTAFDNVDVSDGLKIFLRFREQFYPDMLAINNPAEWEEHHEYLFYDATFGKNVEDHVMGVLIVGDAASEYIDLSDQEIITKLLTELDLVYEGISSETYIDGIVQNWSQTPFIGATYPIGYGGGYFRTMRNLRSDIEQMIYFAGTAYDWDHPGEVGGAVRSASDIANEIIGQE